MNSIDGPRPGLDVDLCMISRNLYWFVLIESAKICILNEVLNLYESQSSVSPAVRIQLLDLHVGLNIDGIIL